MSGPLKASAARRSVRRHLLVGIAAVLAVGGGLGGWAATTRLSGAVIAAGVLVVDTNVKKVQHPNGGVVGEIRVRDGDKVKAGDVLVRLDETLVRANLAIVSKTLDEMVARQARLEAERDDAPAPQFPPELVARAGEENVGRMLAGEQRVFELRVRSREGQKAQLRERIVQLRQEVAGLTGQIEAKTREIALILRELEGVRDLWRKNLVPIQKVMLLERDAARIEGEKGQLIATAAQSKGKISETELQILQIDQDMRTDVAKELREIQAKIVEYVERKVAAEDQLKRIEIRAPQDGIVYQSTVFTVGGVIGQGEPIMLIVPEGDRLTAEVRVSPQDIDHVRVGQATRLRLSAFNQRWTPEMRGTVSRTSADLVVDQRTGAPFYLVRIAFPDAEIAKLAGLKLTPGMPVEAFIETGERTILAYLTRPLIDQMDRSLHQNRPPPENGPPHEVSTGTASAAAR